MTGFKLLARFGVVTGCRVAKALAGRAESLWGFVGGVHVLHCTHGGLCGFAVLLI
jgi:hypothetical protein